MPIPPYVAALRARVGTAELWLPGVTAVVLHEGRVLMTHRTDTDAWALVTGIVDPGEEPAVTAQREVLEECGVHVEVERLVSIGTSGPIVHANGDVARYLDHTFLCRYLSGEPYAADDENHDVAWWPLGEHPPLGPRQSERLADALAGETAARFRTEPRPDAVPYPG